MGCAISVAELEPQNVIHSINAPSDDCFLPFQPGDVEAGGALPICAGGSISFTCRPGSALLNNTFPVPGGELTIDCPDVNEVILLPTPPLTCSRDNGMMGDPHIKKWSGEWYDWHGECDTVFLHAPDFHDGLGLDIHTRTRIRYWYSFIETVAVRIGSDIFEVGSWGDFTLNGVSSPELPQVLGDCCSVTHSQPEEKRHLFSIDLGEDSSIELSTHKDIVSIKIIHQDSPTVEQWFRSSSGLMGSFQEGKSLARNGLTILEDPNDMGQEWQVLDSDPMLFQDSDRAPQFPQKCRLPDQNAEKKQRRLGEGITREAAAKACARWSEDLKENCIYDVMKTNDLGLAAFDGYF